MKTGLAWLLLPVFLLAAACDDETASASLPDAVTLTEDTAGYYCQMIILEHEGPKAQVHLEGYAAPLWFSQVRDGIAYLKSPEQSATILVLYVNDMGAAQSWAEPGASNWINAANAYFVVGSDATGGMGAPEIAPFGDTLKAEAFRIEHGGEIMRLSEISPETVLSPVEIDTAELEANK